MQNSKVMNLCRLLWKLVWYSGWLVIGLLSVHHFELFLSQCTGEDPERQVLFFVVRPQKDISCIVSQLCACWPSTSSLWLSAFLGPGLSSLSDP